LKALVLYHSLFGNTKSVAMSLTMGLEDIGIETTCVGIDDFKVSEVVKYDFIAIGSPTHILKASKPMKDFLMELKTFNLRGKLGFSFDTRNNSKMNKRGLLVLENSASRVIEGWMKRMKMEIVKSRESALVEGREGPLDQRADEVFQQIGREIGTQLKKSG